MSKKMKINKTKISGVYVVETEPFTDHRGSFDRFFCAKELESFLGNRKIVQINHSKTNKIGAVRGMHFQHPPHAEMKLVRCIKGKVFDVALDLRRNSPTFLQWHAEELDPVSAKMLVIPEGCAHGFQVLQEESEIVYLVTEFYNPESEGGIRPNDPVIKISWPFNLKDLSNRDKNHVLIKPSYKGISL